jgi:hypothetical protein
MPIQLLQGGLRPCPSSISLIELGACLNRWQQCSTAVVLKKIPKEDVACTLHVPVGGVVALAALEGSAAGEFVVQVAALATGFTGVCLFEAW